MTTSVDRDRWLFNVLSDGGLECGGGGDWRAITDQYEGDVEACIKCGDEGFNVYVVAEQMETLP